MAIQDEELLTVRQVARRVGRSEETVRRWIWSGKLPAQKLGNQLFVRADDVAGLGRRQDSRPFVEPRRMSNEELKDLVERTRKLRERIRAADGSFDVAEAVRQSRAEH